MRTAIPHHLLSLLVLAAFLLAACGEEGATSSDPETRHCEIAFKRLTKDVRELERGKIKTWVVGDQKNVVITYDGVYGKGDARLRDFFKCTYIAPIGSVQKQAKRIDAVDVMVRGSHMSPAELLLLNTAIQISRPKLAP